MGSYKWVISRVTIVIIRIRGLVTPLITAHEPPSRATDKTDTILIPLARIQAVGMYFGLDLQQAV